MRLRRAKVEPKPVERLKLPPWLRSEMTSLSNWGATYRRVSSLTEKIYNPNRIDDIASSNISINCVWRDEATALVELVHELKREHASTVKELERDRDALIASRRYYADGGAFVSETEVTGG